MLGTVEDLRIWNLFMPSDSHQLQRTDCLEVVQLSCMSIVDDPGFTGVHDFYEHKSLVNLEFWCYG